jgi:hypothetical protein
MAVAELPDGSMVWMDATEKTCAFGDLPWYDRGALVLVSMDDGKARFSRTPHPSGEDACLTRKWELAADDSGAARGSVSMVFTGILAGEMRHQLRRMTDDGMRSWMGRQLLYRLPGAVCDSFRVEDLRNPALPLGLTAAFSSAGFLVRDGDKFSTRPGELALFDLNYVFPEKERRYPVSLQYPMSVEDTLVLRLPANWSLESAVPGDSVFTRFGSCGWRADVRPDGRFLYSRRLRLRETMIESERYAEFREFLNRVAEMDRTGMVFRPNR